MKKLIKIDNLYDKTLTVENIRKTWYIVRKTCKNRKAVYRFALNANVNISVIYKLLKTRTYKPSRFNLFLIFEPKPRLVMSQSIADKIVNHYVTNYYLLPYLEQKLVDCNVATRKNKGSSYAIALLEKYLNILRMKYNGQEIYCLKVDVSKYFYTIDHEILLRKLEYYFADTDVINLIKLIIDETNKPYINEVIDYYNSKYHTNIPHYKYQTGLSIGAMTSQFLAIFFLNDLDHHIKEDLKCKYYVRYMDDFVILDTDVNKLKTVWKDIVVELEKLKLQCNPKSNISRLSKGITFLGYRYCIIGKKLNINYRKTTYKKINKRLFSLKKNDLLKYYKTYSSYYGYLKKIKKVERNFKMKTREKYNYYKERNPKSIILVKEGTFYKTYDDAIILWHIADYKWNNDCISFGSSPYMKVLDKLLHLGLSYGVVQEQALFVSNNDEVYDLYLKLARINYDKDKRRKELQQDLNIILDKKPDCYSKIKNFFDSVKDGDTEKIDQA